MEWMAGRKYVLNVNAEWADIDRIMGEGKG